MNPYQQYYSNLQYAQGFAYYAAAQRQLQQPHPPFFATPPAPPPQQLQQHASNLHGVPFRHQPSVNTNAVPDAPSGNLLLHPDHAGRPQQQPSPALSHSPQLGPAAPASRPSTATSTASQPHTDSTAGDVPAREEFARSASPLTDNQYRARLYWSSRLDSMSTSDAAQLAQAMHDLAGMTVDKLKAAIRGTNSRLSLHLRLSGKKNDLYNALVDQLSSEYYKADKTRFNSMRGVIAQAKISGNAFSTPGISRGSYVRTGDYPNYGASTSTAASSGYGTPGYGTPNYGAGTSAYGATAAARTGAAATTAAANNLPAPRFGGATAYGAGAAAAARVLSTPWLDGPVDEIPIRFRPSPFFRVEKSVSTVVAVPKAAQGDRKTALCSITLTEAQRTLLAKANESPANPQYQVRLYCTSDTNYNQLRAQANQFPAPVEFPATCEIKLNGVTLPANTKGIKKQPGTAPPVNLCGKTGPALTLAAGAANRAEVIYINTEKTFYLVAYLVEYTSVDKVVSRVKAGKTKSKDEVIQSIITLNSDEDVEASSFGLSLKDPLSFSRIDIPIRSAHCEHIACFDAATWFEVNEQTPQWQCPICSKTLKVDDMVVDGYFEDILRVCSSSVDAVTVEPDGTWRSDNGKFGTAKPRSVPQSAAASATTSARSTPAVNGAGAGADGLGPGDKGKGRASDELVLSDGESDDEPLAKRQRLDTGGSGTPYSAAGASNGGGASRRREVVDLTLSSDEDDDPPPPSRPLSGAGVGAASGDDSGGVGMERQLSDRKSAAQVQADIDEMNERMIRDYGPDWKKQFGY